MPVRLWGLSDLHVGHPENRRRMAEIQGSPGDWLVLAGDVGETIEHLRYVVETLSPRFAKLIWAPGNHELWSTSAKALRGQAKYDALVEACRGWGVLTPEDPYPVFDTGEAQYLVAPLFTLYDYSFAPPGMNSVEARDWAMAQGVQCTDEALLHPDPHPTREQWCAERCRWTEERLTRATTERPLPTVLINHFPLLRELARLPAVPSFRIWCGTERTAHWHRRFRAELVVYGHLHIPGTKRIDGVRFEEVSMGYPRQWRRDPARLSAPRLLLPSPGAG